MPSAPPAMTRKSVPLRRRRTKPTRASFSVRRKRFSCGVMTPDRRIRMREVNPAMAPPANPAKITQAHLVTRDQRPSMARAAWKRWSVSGEVLADTVGCQTSTAPASTCSQICACRWGVSVAFAREACRTDEGREAGRSKANQVHRRTPTTHPRHHSIHGRRAFSLPSCRRLFIIARLGLISARSRLTARNWA